MKIEPIVEMIGKTDSPVVSFVGAGGKTSCMLKWRTAWFNKGKKCW